MKIISAGFPKTGTKSASEALSRAFTMIIMFTYMSMCQPINQETQETIVRMPVLGFLATMFVMFLIPHILELPETGLIL